MTNVKRGLSLLMVLTMLVSMFSITGITVSAAKSAAKNTVSYNAVTGGTISSKTNSFTINGNFWTKKKVTICGYADFPNDQTQNAFYSLARFNVTVKDKNGKVVATYYNERVGTNFYLPKWSTQKYTITITSSFSGYNRSNAYHSAAALRGKYYLKY